VPSTFTDLIRASKRAEEEAQEAEDALDAAFARYFRQLGPPPTVEQRAVTRALRERSRALLKKALDHLDER
jgi:hypothetical protein